MSAGLNRRRFIAASTIGAAGVHSFASESSGGDVLNVAVVGLNGRGGEHIRALLNDDRCRIVALVDVDPAVASRRADQIAEAQGGRPDIYVDVRRVLDRDDVDAVTIATPNHWHALMGVWAMDAGKHVYLEKPISHNVREGRALVEAAKRTGRVFQTGTQCRSSRAIIDGIRYIADGGIGECRFARGLCYKRRKSIGPRGDYPPPADIDMELWCGPAPDTDPPLTRGQFHYDWHWQRHYGNGDSGNQGPHQTDIARWGLQLDRHPNRIITYGGRLGYDVERKNPKYVDAGDTANTQVSLYDYGDRTIVFETRGLASDGGLSPDIRRAFGDGPGNRIGVLFYGDEGYVAQTQYTEMKVFDLDWNLRETFRSRDPTGEHFDDFVSAILASKPESVAADAMCGHLSASIAHLGNISYYLGESNRATVSEIRSAVESFPSRDDDAATLRNTVEHLRGNGVDLQRTPLSIGPSLSFDPDAETFVDNDDADALLTRTYRSGFEIR